MRAGWTFNDIRKPPLGQMIWALIESPSDGEPYLIEAMLTEIMGAGSVAILYDGPSMNYLPPHHAMIAWRRVRD